MRRQRTLGALPMISSVVGVSTGAIANETTMARPRRPRAHRRHRGGAGRRYRRGTRQPFATPATRLARAATSLRNHRRSRLPRRPPRTHSVLTPQEYVDALVGAGLAVERLDSLHARKDRYELSPPRTRRDSGAVSPNLARRSNKRGHRPSAELLSDPTYLCRGNEALAEWFSRILPFWADLGLLIPAGRRNVVANSDSRMLGNGRIGGQNHGATAKCPWEDVVVNTTASGVVLTPRSAAGVRRVSGSPPQ